MKRKLFILLLLTSAGTIEAQDAVNNTGNLQIFSGASITGFGNLTNSSSGVLVNNGSLYIKRNLTNHQSSMAAGSGTLYFNGSSAQSFNGSQIYKTNNLETNNSIGITLDNDLSVSGIHTFTNGLIFTSTTPNYLVYEAGSSYSGENDSRHIAGWVKKNGNSNFIFPVGDNSYLRPVALSGLSVISEFNCHYYTPTQNIFNLLSPLVNVKRNEYWQIDKVSGGTASVTLNWDHSKVPMDNILLTDIVAGHYTGSNWTNAGGTATGNVTTTGSVTSNAISSFSPFTLAYGSFPIPLKLLSFTGWRRSGTTYLHWITENEQDVDRFAVQRSSDGIVFDVIGVVSARNRGIKEVYSFNDPTSFTGIAYYRLCSFDIDGKYSYSRIIALSESSSYEAAFIVINPVQTSITIFNKTSIAGLYDYRLYSSLGQLIVKGEINFGSNSVGIIRLPLQVSYGIYTLELQNGKTHFRQQILVEK